MTKNYRDALTGKWTTAADAAARPAETVAESVPARHETPDVAELRRRLDALPGFTLRYIGSGPGGYIALSDEGGMPLSESGFDAVLLFAEIAALEVPRLLDRLAYMTEARDNARAEVERLSDVVAGRCLSDITHRDEEHRQSFCMLPADHAPLAHDDCMGCTWTDADYWQPQAVERLADELRAVADESQHEGWDSPAVRRVVERLTAAFDDGTES